MENSNLKSKDVTELEALYERAVRKGDEELADLILFIILEKQTACL